MATVVRTLRKFFVSGFVVFTFVAYALHERVVHATPPVGTAAPGQTAVALVVPTPTQLIPTPSTPAAAATVLPTAPELAPATPEPSPVPTGTPVPTEPATPTSVPPAATAVANGRYKDGQYTGTVADAYYGNLQVQAVIKQGKITDVQFLDYPHDRRTSQRINSQAMPYLQEEAIQVQSAQVDLVSGATLTSQAFVESLQAALSSAKG